MNEKSEIGNQTNHILMPRLYERKKVYNSNFHNKDFLRKKRHSKNNSESKKKYLENKSKKYMYIIFSLGEFKENKELNDSNSSSYSFWNSNEENKEHVKDYNNKISNIKCFKFGKYGHIATECWGEKDDICEKCLKYHHKGEECPNEKCYLCNSRGHKPTLCPLKKNNQYNNKNKYIASKIPKCTKCLNNGHESIDCLIKPNNIYINNPSKLSLCRFCNSTKHYVCPFKDDIYIISDYDSDKVDISENEKDNKFKNSTYIKNYKINKNNFNSLLQYFLNEGKKYEKENIILGKISSGITKEQIKINNFCCKCGNIHYYKDCGKIITKKKYLEENDDDCYINLKNNNFLYHKKNPLKFEPYAKSEYKINHHDIKYDYYEQNDSSGESFKEMYKK